MTGSSAEESLELQALDEKNKEAANIGVKVKDGRKLVRGLEETLSSKVCWTCNLGRGGRKA
jgi:hypothetical protein